MKYLYLHGFASGPGSKKAQYLRSQFQPYTHPLPLQIPNLNQPDFAQLTLTRQIQQGTELITSETTLIGSSFGGLTAAWIAEQPSARLLIKRLILLAPAFQFLNQWLPRLGPAQVDHWKTTGWLSVYHYAANCQKRLHYDFVTDAQQYDEAQLQSQIPTLILHGVQDDVIAIDTSRDYARTRPWVTLTSLETDHSMTGAMGQIWQEISAFCEL